MEVASGGGDQSASSLEYLHVLAVDDSFVDRKVIERLLRNSACRVTTVESGLRALQFLGLEGERAAAEFKDLKVNLIMTDYSMPGITGYELLKKIKESSEFREIPVVIMSSENILPRIEKCLEEGAKEFILKPVKLSDVKRLKDILMKEELKECESREETNKCRLEGDVATTTGLSPSSSSSSSSSSSRDVSSIAHQNKSDSGAQR